MKRALAITVIMLSVGTALAQSKPSKDKPGKVIRLEEINIEGKVQKPNAFYILNRGSFGYDVLELRTSFLKEIVVATQKKPF